MREVPMTIEVQNCIDRWNRHQAQRPIMGETSTPESFKNWQAVHDAESLRIQDDLKAATAERVKRWVLMHAPDYDLAARHHPETQWADLQRTVKTHACGCAVAHIWSVRDPEGERRHHQIEIAHACDLHAHIGDPVKHHEAVDAHNKPNE